MPQDLRASRSARKGTEVSFETSFLKNGRTVRGVIQGDSVPKKFIPCWWTTSSRRAFSSRTHDSFLSVGRHQSGRGGIERRQNHKTGILRMPHRQPSCGLGLLGDRHKPAQDGGGAFQAILRPRPILEENQLLVLCRLRIVRMRTADPARG